MSTSAADRGLARALHECDPHAAHRALRQGANPRALAPAGGTVLAACAADRRLEGVVETLLECGADPDSRDAQGRLAVVLALLAGNEEALAALVAAHANTARIDAEGNSLLAAAVVSGNYDAVRDCLDRVPLAGAMIEQPNAVGQTPLMLAARGAAPAIAWLLLARGADPAPTDQSGQRAGDLCEDPTLRGFLQTLTSRRLEPGANEARDAAREDIADGLQRLRIKMRADRARRIAQASQDALPRARIENHSEGASEPRR